MSHYNVLQLRSFINCSVHVCRGRARRRTQKEVSGTLDETPQNQISAGPKNFKTRRGHEAKNFKTCGGAINFETEGATRPNCF